MPAQASQRSVQLTDLWFDLWTCISFYSNATEAHSTKNQMFHRLQVRVEPETGPLPLRTTCPFCRFKLLLNPSQLMFQQHVFFRKPIQLNSAWKLKEERVGTPGTGHHIQSTCVWSGSWKAQRSWRLSFSCPRWWHRAHFSFSSNQCYGLHLPRNKLQKRKLS